MSITEEQTVKNVLSDIAAISRQDNLTEKKAVSQILAIKPVKRVFTYRLDRQKGCAFLGIVISPSNEAELTRESRLVVRDVTLRLN
jgi:hypothetical protein